MVDREEDLEDFSDYWSVSKLQAIQQCGRKFKFQYIEKVPALKTVALKFGSAVHKCLERIHKESLFEDGQVQRLWADVWSPYIGTIDWDNELASKTVYKNRGLKMLDKYVQSHKDEEVLHLEMKFKIKPSDELPKFGGVIDKIKMVDGRPAVVDYKTSKYAPDPLVLDADPQLTMYYMAAKVLGLDISDFAIHNLLDGTEYWTTRSDEDVYLLLESIEEAQQKVRSKMFARSVGFNCKFCDYKESCLSGYRKTSPELPPVV